MNRIQASIDDTSSAAPVAVFVGGRRASAAGTDQRAAAPAVPLTEGEPGAVTLACARAAGLLAQAPDLTAMISRLRADTSGSR